MKGEEKGREGRCISRRQEALSSFGNSLTKLSVRQFDLIQQVEEARGPTTCEELVKLQLWRKFPAVRGRKTRGSRKLCLITLYTDLV